MKCKDIIDFMESMAPPSLAEEWDNVGLMLGSKGQDVRRVLVCLDVTAAVAAEAVEKKVDMIVSHHPLIFKGIKRLNADDAKGRIIYKLIKNDIAVYSAHTNLDVADQGVNEQLAKALDLRDLKILNRYREERLFKIVVFVPKDNADEVREAMGEAGAGHIGNYSHCSFMAEGIGTFKPLEGTNPYIGSENKLEKVEECRLETIVPERILEATIKAMKAVHPYEEVAYDVFLLELKGKEYGLGKVGLLEEEMSFDQFIAHVKHSLGMQRVKIIGEAPQSIKKVAVFCGSFDENYSGICRSGAQALVTGDIKYHAAMDMVEKGLCVVDPGHFGTEHVVVPALAKIIKEKFQEVDVIASQVEKDPIKIS